MSLSSTIDRVSYAGNGSTSSFSFGYKLIDQADLVVIIKDNTTGVETVKTLSTHYTISGTLTNNVYESGVSVTMLSVPTSTQTVIIYRDKATIQELELTENGKIPSDNLEKQLDKITMMVQRVKNKLARTIGLKEGFTASFDTTLPNILQTKGYLRTNETNNGFEYISEADLIDIVGFGNTFNPDIVLQTNSLGNATSSTISTTELGYLSGASSNIQTQLNSSISTANAIGSVPNANGITLSGKNLTLQPANSTFGGVVTAIAQSFTGVKTFVSDLIVSSTTQSTDKDTGSIVTEGGLGVEKNINAGGNILAVGTVTGSNLSNTNTGDITLSAIGASPNANGASLSGQAVTLQPASSSFGGVVTAIAQSFAGVKTFVTDIVANTLVQFNGSTSGFVKVQAPATPTSYTLTLPPTAGTADYILKTNGSGVTDWVAQSGAGGANATLSNLTSPTAINQDLIFSPFGDATIKTQDNSTGGNSRQLYVTTGDANANLNTGNLRLLTGNTSGTGAAGAIVIQAGQNQDTGVLSTVEVTADRTILFSNNLVVSSGFGIDFSATANGSGTTASELLNDYERGTFTATLTATTGTITLVSTQDTMAYVKVGDKVTITGQIVVQSVSAPTGTLTLNGLPFTSAVGTELSTRTAMSVRGDALTATAVTALQGFVLASSNTATIEKFSAGAVSALAANVQAGSNFMISLTYFTA